MAVYPSLGVADLSAFSGREIESYSPVYAATAIKQATLLFKIATCLTALPDDEVSYELAVTAILAMADYAVLSQPFAQAQANPFSSENIGSYSYSKMAVSARSGKQTGVAWFDLAVSEIGVCSPAGDAPFFGGIEAMEHDGWFAPGASEGNRRLVTSATPLEVAWRATSYDDALE